MRGQANTRTSLTVQQNSEESPSRVGNERSVRRAVSFNGETPALDPWHGRDNANQRQGDVDDGPGLACDDGCQGSCPATGASRTCRRSVHSLWQGSEAWTPLGSNTRNHLKPKTVAGYQSLLNTHLQPRFGTTPLYRIDHLDIEQFIADLTNTGLSPSRTRQVHQLLSTILKAAVRSRKLGTNPADGITLPHIYPKTKRFIDTDQIEQLANVVPDRYESWINSAAYGGLRWAELAGLRRKASTPSNNDSQSPKASAK
jgi:hypothetical protein